jgi:hypothetical protein
MLMTRWYSRSSWSRWRQRWSMERAIGQGRNGARGWATKTRKLSAADAPQAGEEPHPPFESFSTNAAACVARAAQRG